MTPTCPMCSAFMIGVRPEGPWLVQWACRACGTVVVPHVGGHLDHQAEQLHGADRAPAPGSGGVRNSDEGKERP